MVGCSGCYNYFRVNLGYRFDTADGARDSYSNLIEFYFTKIGLGSQFILLVRTVEFDEYQTHPDQCFNVSWKAYGFSNFSI